MEKYGLVLEGGGLRGAYTAGALSWLNDHDITLDYGVGISSGAVYLSTYALKKPQLAYDFSTKYACQKEIVGLQAILKEGYYVAYNYMFQELLRNQLHFELSQVKHQKLNIEVGAYDLQQGKTEYFGYEYFEDDLKILQGCCALPIASAIVEYQGRKLLDGGITKMIPIERSIQKGNTKHLIITTKPETFVRKPASNVIKFLMKHVYHQYPSVLEDYKVRHINYYKQIGMIEALKLQGNALVVSPSKTIAISRFKGDPENCKILFELGYQDMESQKNQILSFLNR